MWSQLRPRLPPRDAGRGDPRAEPDQQRRVHQLRRPERRDGDGAEHDRRGEADRSELLIAAQIGNIHYGLNVLRHGLVDGGLLCARMVGQTAVEGRLPIPIGPTVRLVELAADVHPLLQLVSGVSARKGEPSTHEERLARADGRSPSRARHDEARGAPDRAGEVGQDDHHAEHRDQWKCRLIDSRTG